MGNGFQCRGTKCIPGRNVPSHRDRPLPRQATDAPLGLTGGGPGSARPWVGRWLHLGMSPLGHRPFVCGSTIMLCSGLRLALFAGAQSAPLRENRLSRHFRAFLRKPIRAGLGPAEGRAPHARKEGTGSSEARRHRLTATEAPILGNERPRHEYGLATRTRGAHPSEKTTARVVSGFSPQGHSCRAWPPWRGGLRTPAMTPLGSPEHVPPGPPGVRSPLRDHAVPRPAPCPVSRTRRPRPSEKTPSRVIPGLAPQGHFALG